MRSRIRPALIALLIAPLLLAAACSSSGGDTSSSAPGTAKVGDAASTASSGSATGSDTGATTDANTMDILVSNDDGYAADGIDNLVTALEGMKDVKVTVVAPLTNQSSTGGKTTPGKLTHSNVLLKSGTPAVAVNGYPADSVNVALDELGIKPDIVVTGTNLGSNLGPVIDVSGTVGAARAGAAHGIPAVASSAGLGNPMDFQSTTDAVVKWLEDHRSEIVSKKAKATVTNINGPSCGTTGKVRGTVEVPAASASNPTTADVSGGTPNCSSTVTDPKTDVDAVANGYIAISTIPNKPAS